MKILNIQKQAFIQNLEKAFSEGVYADTYQNRKLGRVGQPYKKGDSSKKEDIDDNQKKTDNKKERELSKDEKRFVRNVMRNSDNLGNVDLHAELKKLKLPKLRTVPKEISNVYKNTTLGGNDLSAKAAEQILEVLPEKNYKMLIKKDKLKSLINKNEDRKKRKEIYSNMNVENLIKDTTTLKNAKGSRLDAIISYSNSEGADGIKVDKNASDKEKRIAIAKFYAEAAENDADNLDEIIEDALADYVPKKEENYNNKEIVDKLVYDSILTELKPSQLDNIIAYSNSDGAEGVKIDSSAPARKKARAIAEFYAEAAEGDVENFNSILEDAIEDYVSKK